MTPESQQSADETQPQVPGSEPPEKQDEHARLFYERLEQTRQLVDVKTEADAMGLPPQITHVRYPDGTVERIGFSASPYGG